MTPDELDRLARHWVDSEFAKTGGSIRYEDCFKAGAQVYKERYDVANAVCLAMGKELESRREKLDEAAAFVKELIEEVDYLQDWVNSDNSTDFKRAAKDREECKKLYLERLEKITGSKG